MNSDFERLCGSEACLNSDPERSSGSRASFIEFSRVLERPSGHEAPRPQGSENACERSRLEQKSSYRYIYIKTSIYYVFYILVCILLYSYAPYLYQPGLGYLSEHGVPPYEARWDRGLEFRKTSLSSCCAPSGPWPAPALYGHAWAMFRPISLCAQNVMRVVNECIK